MQPLVVTRFAIVNALGAGAGAVLEGLKAKRSGLAPCDFEIATLDTWVGKVPGLEARRVRRDLEEYDCRSNRLAQMGLEQDAFTDAVASARARYGAARIGVFIGTSTSGILETELAYRQRDPQTQALPAGFRYQATQNTYSLGDFVRRYLGLTGPAFVVSSACSSSAKVFGNAARMIAAGACDAAVVGGADTLCLTSLYGFHSLELISRQPCRPFDAERDGISLGEGAAFVLLEKQPRAGSELALLGYGESADAHHMSTPHPEGLGAALAMRAALEGAGLAPGDLGYINLHGTGTRNNDSAEDAGVFSVVGDRVPCSGTKGWTGHALGAAGAIEAVLTLLCLRHGYVPGTLNTQRIDPALRTQLPLEGRSAPLEHAMSNSFGFGGNNCSLVFGRRH